MKKHIRASALLGIIACLSLALSACADRPQYGYYYPNNYYYANGYQYAYPDNYYHSGYFYDPSWNRNSQFYDSNAQPIHYIP